MMTALINALDGMESPLWTGNGAPAQSFAYAPYGGISPDHHADGLLPGFNGERLDPISLTYHLGNGYRTYNPTLMRFNAPDNWSPFGAGGLNAYAYCEGDPINRSDPSGHVSGHAIAGIVLGAIGLFLDVLTGGMAIAAEGSIAAAWAAASAEEIVMGGFGAVGDLTSIASGAVTVSNPKLADALGWATVAMGAIGLFASLSTLSHSTYARYRRTGRRTALLADEEQIELVPLNAPRPNPSGQKNLTFHPEGFVTFEDQDGERLSIGSHGHAGVMSGPNPGSKIKMNAADLHRILEEKNLYEGHSRLRVFSCHSADKPSDGGMSLAQELAERSGLPTMGFHGSAWSVYSVMPGQMKSVYKEFRKTGKLPVMDAATTRAMATGPYFKTLSADPRNHTETFFPSWRRHTDR